MRLKMLGKWNSWQRYQTKMKTEMSRSYNLWICFEKLCFTSYVSFENIDKHSGNVLLSLSTSARSIRASLSVVTATYKFKQTTKMTRTHTGTHTHTYMWNIWWKWACYLQKYIVIRKRTTNEITSPSGNLLARRLLCIRPILYTYTLTRSVSNVGFIRRSTFSDGLKVSTCA